MSLVLGYLASLGTVGTIVANVVVSAVLGAVSRKLVGGRRERVGSQPPDFSREVTVNAADEYENFIYGRALVGGQLVYKNAVDVGSANDVMMTAVKWAGHEVNCFELFRFDDYTLDPSVDSLEWDATSYGQGNDGVVRTGQLRASGNFDPPVALRYYRGDQSSADHRMVAEASEWTTAHLGADRAYGVLEIRAVNENDQVNKAWPTGFPRNVQALAHGKSVYDHRFHALNADPYVQNVNSGVVSQQNDSSAIESGNLSHGLSLPEWSVASGIGGKYNRGIQVTDNDAGREYVGTEMIRVDPSSQYTFFVNARRTIGDRSVAFTGYWLDADGAQVGFFTYVNTQIGSEWEDFYTTQTPHGSATYATFGVNRVNSHASFATNTTQIQIRELGFYLGTDSRQYADQPDTWRYSSSPPPCIADYVRNERFGFGKESRMRVSPTRYAQNGDPGFRRRDTLSNGSHWLTDPQSGIGSSIDALPSSLHSNLVGAPAGRRALVVVASVGGTVGERFHSNAIPIDQSGHYIISVQAKQDGVRQAYLLAAFLDGDGNNITGNGSGDAVGWDALGTYHYFGAVQEPLASAWSEYLIDIGSGASASIPSCASFISIGALCVRSVGGDSGETAQYFQDYQVHVGTQIRHFIEPHEQIYWPSVSSLAAYCDEQVATPSGTQARFTFNGEGYTGKSYRANLSEMATAVPGMRIVYSQSGFVFLGGWEEASRTINAADLDGKMVVDPEYDEQDRYNHVRGIFHDQHQNFKAVPYATVSAAEYSARDNSLDLFEDYNLRWTSDWYEAQRAAFGVLEQGDNQMSAQVPLKSPWWALMVGRHVKINLGVSSFVNKDFLMTDLTYDPERLSLKANVREDFQASYTDPSTLEYRARDGTLSSTSGAVTVPQVASVQLTARIGGVQLQWVNPSARRFEWVDVYRRTTNAFSGSTLIKSTRNDELFDSQRPNIQYYYWFQTRDFRGNVSSVYPGLTTSFTNVGLAPVFRDPEHVFMEEFDYQTYDQFSEKWEDSGFTSIPSGSAITFPLEGITGGRVLQASSTEAWYVARDRIPYDPEALYQIRAVTRMTTSHALRSMYVGFIGYAGDKTTRFDTNSANTFGGHYIALYNYDPSSEDVWEEHVGHVRGHMPWPLSGSLQDTTVTPREPGQAARMHQHTRYVSPMFILSNDDGDGVQQIDGIYVRKIVPNRTVVFDQDITLESNWLTYASIFSLDVNNGPLCTFIKESVAGRFGVIQGPVSQNSNQWGGVTERSRTDYHTIYSAVGSSSIYWSALTYVHSDMIGNWGVIAPTLRLYLPDGRLAFSAAYAGFVFSGSQYPRGVWTSVGTLLNIGDLSTIDTTSYPPPWYVSLGADCSTHDSRDFVYIARVAGWIQP